MIDQDWIWIENWCRFAISLPDDSDGDADNDGDCLTDDDDGDD